LKTAEQNNAGLIGTLIDYTDRRVAPPVQTKPLTNEQIREQLLKAEPSLKNLFSIITGDCDSRDMGQRIVDAVKILLNKQYE